jgi:NADH-quinone oxidoreductase subunit A
MPTLVFVLTVFLVVSVVFLFIHLMMGKVIRPARPDADKLTIYECGEPTIGSAWVQFDLRYYVVALLFVIFDVEVAFFFPWAVTFGKANELSRPDLSPERRAQLSQQVKPATLPAVQAPRAATEAAPVVSAKEARNFAEVAMLDLLVFFGVLLVGFAYLWKRGDIDWVKTVAAERLAEAMEPPAIFKQAAVTPAAAPAPLVGAGHH